MSNAAINPAGIAAPAADPHAGHNHNHDPHLAHHFDTPEQQYASAKLGMWVFLGTEILMFGGLFCGYAVYRHNHPDVFEYAHHFLDKALGAVNTLVLITSSLTMAWAVRSSQLGNQTSLRWLMAITILGGYAFLGIKSIEYHKKWQHHLFIGTHNKYRTEDSLKDAAKEEVEENTHGLPGENGGHSASGSHVTNPVIKVESVPAEKTSGVTPPEPRHDGIPASATPAIAKTTTVQDPVTLAPPDPNKGTGDEAKIVPTFHEYAGLAVSAPEPAPELSLATMSAGDQKRLYTFFGVYFFMTGLHGLHVVIGMSLIFWVLIRSVGPRNVPWAVPMIPASIGVFLAVVGVIIGLDAGTKLIMLGLGIAVLSVIWALLWAPMRRNRSAQSEFGPTYFTPVDLVGLYWHLVDLIWIFLFPLLYLIH